MKPPAQVDILAIGGKPTDEVLTVFGDAQDPRLALLRWPGAPPLVVYREELERALAGLKP